MNQHAEQSNQESSQASAHAESNNSSGTFKINDQRALQRIPMRSQTQIQLKQIEEATSLGGLDLKETGHKFSVVDEVSKPGAKLYSGTEVRETAADKGAALTDLSARAGSTAAKVSAVVNKNYTTNKDNFDKSEVDTIDPFSHGHIQEFGDSSDYICLMYQQTKGFDGYVHGIEEGKVTSPGKYAQNFQKSMKHGRSIATMDGEAPADGNYKDLHDQDVHSSLLDIAKGDTEGKADAITKLAGEGARFIWVRDNISTIQDNTLFPFDTKWGKASIPFNKLWVSWKDWFKGAYNISEAAQATELKKRVESAPKSDKVTKRINLPDHEELR